MHNFAQRLAAPPLLLLSLLACCLALCLVQISASAQDKAEWRPVTPAELELKKPTVEPDADAEAIFWEVRLDDKKSSKLSYKHYVRVKIFTERGREKFSKFDIPFLKGKKVENVAARVIKSDGSIVELKPEDVFERDILTVRKVKVKAKSFAVPGIEPGVIVEYQYDEIIKGDSANGERLVFQRDIPMQKVSYRVRPFGGSTLVPKFYNMPESRFVEDTANKGFFVATMHNVPSLKEEPFMPPDDEVKRWVYLQYQNIGTLLQWNFLSQGYGEFLKKVSKPNKEIKQKVAELTAGALTEEEKLKRIYNFAQKQIKNVTFDRSISEEQRENVKIKDADDVLRTGMGNAPFIDLLFASLARAAEFEVNIVLAGDRSNNFFDPNKYPFPSFIHPACIAVKVGGQWKFFNPGTPYLPFGRLVWYEEDVAAMLIGDGGHIWKKTPLSGHSSSLAKRTGKLKLSEDGTLEGDVRIEYDGHQAISRRRAGFFDSPGKREEDFKEELKRRMSAAEIVGLAVENFEDASKPLAYSFKIRVPNYAQKTGKRLFFQPGFFEYGSTPVFSSATRTHSIAFDYPWAEHDFVEIEMPKGFQTDNADAPGSVGDSGKISSLNISMGVDQANHTIIYRRNFYFGGGGAIQFPVESYQPLKALFDAFHKADTHTITLKQNN
jgi:hypothetical protein